MGATAASAAGGGGAGAAAPLRGVACTPGEPTGLCSCASHATCVPAIRTPGPLVRAPLLHVRWAACRSASTPEAAAWTGGPARRRGRTSSPVARATHAYRHMPPRSPDVSSVPHAPWCMYECLAYHAGGPLQVLVQAQLCCGGRRHHGGGARLHSRCNRCVLALNRARRKRPGQRVCRSTQMGTVMMSERKKRLVGGSNKWSRRRFVGDVDQPWLALSVPSACSRVACSDSVRVCSATVRCTTPASSRARKLAAAAWHTQARKVYAKNKKLAARCVDSDRNSENGPLRLKTWLGSRPQRRWRRYASSGPRPPAALPRCAACSAWPTLSMLCHVCSVHRTTLSVKIFKATVQARRRTVGSRHMPRLGRFRQPAQASGALGRKLRHHGCHGAHLQTAYTTTRTRSAFPAHPCDRVPNAAAPERRAAPPRLPPRSDGRRPAHTPPTRAQRPASNRRGPCTLSWQPR